MHGIKWNYIVEMAVTTCFTFSIEAMVRGYHVYQSVWEVVNGEVLECSREIGNRSDPYAVAVTKSSGETGGTVTVGHVPRSGNLSAGNSGSGNSFGNCRFTGLKNLNNAIFTRIIIISACRFIY